MVVLELQITEQFHVLDGGPYTALQQGVVGLNAILHNAQTRKPYPVDRSSRIPYEQAELMYKEAGGSWLTWDSVTSTWCIQSFIGWEGGWDEGRFAAEKKAAKEAKEAAKKIKQRFFMTQEESSAVLTSLSNANSLDKSDGEEDDVLMEMMPKKRRAKT